MSKRLHTVVFLSLDFIWAALAYGLFFSFRRYVLDEPIAEVGQKQILSSLAIGVFWVTLYWMAGMYRRVERRSRWKDFQSLFLVSVIGSLVIFFVLLLDDAGVQSYQQYYKTLAALFSIQFCLSAFGRIFLLSIYRRRIAKGLIRFNALVIGSGDKASELVREIESSHVYLGLNILGYVNPVLNGQTKLKNLRELGSLDQLETLVNRTHCQDVLVALDKSDHHKLEEIIQRLEDVNVQTSITPDMYEILIGSVRIEHLFGAPLIEVKQELIPVWLKVVKRLMDILMSILVLVLGSPFLILFALITKFSSKGPAFFFQERIGYKGKPFKIIKYRSMFVDAEKAGPQLSSSDDPRITGWGRFMRRTRIDELPQFLNVLKGDMSVVGPRPERKFFVDQITKVAPHYRHIIKVKPGITSLGQIKVGYAEDVDQMVKRLKYDILYLENISFALDLRILFFTIFIILQGRGK